LDLRLRVLALALSQYRLLLSLDQANSFIISLLISISTYNIKVRT